MKRAVPAPGHWRLPGAWGAPITAAFAIAAAAAVAYAPALGGGYVFDDHFLVETSALLRGPLWRIWFSTEPVDYWPLTYTSFWLEWRIFGATPFAHHLVNVCLHAAAGVLLWHVLRRLRAPGAWLGGLLFVLHPVAVESVAWISERKNVLSGALYLASMLMWLAHRDEGGRRRYAAALVLFLLALLAKTSTVVLPVVLLGIVLARDRALRRRDLLALAPFFALSLAAGLLTLRFQLARALGDASLGIGLAERVSGAAWALAFYLQKAFVPVFLGFLYPRWPVAPDTAAFRLPLLLLAAVAAMLWRYRHGRARPLALAVAYCAVVVLPVLGLTDLAFFDFSRVANHLEYLALMAPAALAGAALSALAVTRPRPATALAATLATLLGVRTAQRAAAFRDDGTLWAHAEREQPQVFMATWMHVSQLAAAGQQAASLQALADAAGRFADPADRHRARALLLVERTLVPEGLAEARAASAFRPDPVFDFKLGSGLRKAGHAAEAVELLEPVVRSAPQTVLYRLELGAALRDAGRLPDAAQVLTEACRLSPDRGAGCLALVSVRRQMGSRRDVRSEIADVLGASPSAPGVDAALAHLAELAPGAPMAP